MGRARGGQAGSVRGDQHDGVFCTNDVYAGRMGTRREGYPDCRVTSADLFPRRVPTDFTGSPIKNRTRKARHNAFAQAVDVVASRLRRLVNVSGEESLSAIITMGPTAPFFGGGLFSSDVEPELSVLWRWVAAVCLFPSHQL